MYKMITIDCDDTLLTDDMTVTEGTKQALAKAVERGVIVTLATGRMFASAKNIAKQIELNVPIITYQGSLIKNLMDEAVLYERSVPAEVARQLFEYAEAENLHLQAYYNDELYAQNDNERVRKYSAMSKVPYRIEPDLMKLVDKPLMKLLFFDEPEKLDKLEQELHHRFGHLVHITKSKPYFLEIMHREGTKGHAVRFLADYYGCGISEVIAIGDSWNDKEMIEVAGLGVAMENAVDSLKEIADFITLSNNDDGVKHVIERFILKV
jgi:Cof subfamily protein (haloacid dehalogenase superfamily)